MSEIFSDEQIQKAYDAVDASVNSAKIRAKYELIADLLAEVNDEIKSLDLANYWPARIGGYVHYALADAKEALEEFDA
jgi:hypothetical protein